MTDDVSDLRARWAGGARNLTATPPPSVAFARAIRVAALSLWFNPRDLWRSVSEPKGVPDNPDLAWLEALRHSCIVDSTDARQWMLLDRERLPLLAQWNKTGELDSMCQRAASFASGSTPRMLSDILNGRFEIDEPGEGLANAKEVIRWLEAIHADVKVPTSAALAGRLELRARAVELDHLSHAIVGREEDLKSLVQFVRHAWRAGPSEQRLSLFILEGIGGIGKSTLAADFARHHLPREHADPVLLWIDYDKLRIRPDDIRTVLLEIARQLGWAFPEAAESLQNAREAIRNASKVKTDRTIARAAIDTIAAALVGAQAERVERPILLVLDTFEQVERAPGQTEDILGVLASLRARLFDRFAVLACGRAVFSQGFGDVAVHDLTRPLHGLSRDASFHLLTGRGGLGDHAARKFLSLFDDLGDSFPDTVGIPMLLMLIARLVREKQFELEGEDIDAIRSAADGVMAAAYIYDRVLAQVPQDLRALAHPGLVLPEVSAEAIEAVIWPAIYGPDYRLGPDRAQKLFERLSRETWLVEPVAGSDPPRVRHRADLRRAMLRKMVADPDEDVRLTLVRLHHLARDWHKSELRSKRLAERRSANIQHHQLGQAYHALQLSAMTGQPPAISLSRIRPIRDQLACCIEDFPGDYQPVVRALLGEAIEPTDLHKLDARLRTSLITDLVRSYALRSDAIGGIAFARKLDVDSRTLTPSIARWILRSYIASGQWLSAADVAAPLVDGPAAAAFRFGRTVPVIRPYFAAAQIYGLPAVRRTLEAARTQDYLPPHVVERYHLLGALFAQVEKPGRRNRTLLLELLERFALSQRPGRGNDEALRLLRIYGALLRKEDPGRHSLPSFASAARRGAHAVGIATLLELETDAPSRRTSAQWIAACKAMETRMEKGRMPLHVKFVTLLDDFHVPLGEALASALPDSDALFRFATEAWSLIEERPADLRPARFAEDCADYRMRRERMRTLVAFVDRSGSLGALLAVILDLFSSHPDVAQIAATAQRWRLAFEGPE